jgi:ribosomal protein L37AE/L43A
VTVLIEKDREYPLRLIMYDALLERILKNHLKIPLIEQDYKAWRAGYKGELQTDYRLSFLPEKGYHIFRDLRLADEDWHFQIDTLILTLRYILLIETKNYSGTLFFDKDSEQIIQTKVDIEKSYDNPITQVTMQAWHLKRWLKHYKFQVPPIYHLVVISNSSTIIKTNDRSLNKVVVKGDVLLNRVLQIDGFNSNTIFTEKEVRKLSKLLLKKHTPHHPDILKPYSLTQADLQTGVQCPSCQTFGMQRDKWLWKCPVCKHKSQKAHYKTIKDYFLLINPSIHNQAFRGFANCLSIKTASNILSSMNLPSTGTKKGRIYHMPPDIETFFNLKDPAKK